MWKLTNCTATSKRTGRASRSRSGTDQAEDIQASAGQKSRDTKTEWRKEETRYPYRYGQSHTAGNRTGHKPNM